MADEEIEDEEGVEEAKPSKLPLIAGVLGAFLVGGGLGFVVPGLLAGDEPEPTEVSAEADAEPEEDAMPEEKPGRQRTVESLGSFNINLRGSGGGRILRTVIQLEVPQVAATDVKDDDENVGSVVDKKLPMLRSSAITLISDYTYADLEGLDGKTRLRDELLVRLNAEMDSKSKISRIYFTEFIVQ